MKNGGKVKVINPRVEGLSGSTALRNICAHCVRVDARSLSTGEKSIYEEYDALLSQA